MLIQISSIFHCLHDRCKIIICQNHRRRILSNFASGHTHCNTDIRFFESGCIVYTVTCHGNNVAFSLPSLNDSDFVFGRNSCINRNFLNFFVKLLIAHCVKLKTSNCDVAVIENTNLLCDCTCCDFVVARNHNRLDSCTDCIGNSLF